MTAYCNHARARRSFCANCVIRVGAVDGKPWQVGKCFHVVDDGWLAVQTICSRKERWLQARHAAVAFKAFNKRGLFAHYVCTSAPVQHDVYGEVGTQNVFTNEAGCVCLVECGSNTLLRKRHLAPNVQEALRQTSRVTRNKAAFNQLVRVALHQQAVLICARLALVAVDNQIARPHLLRS